MEVSPGSTSAAAVSSSCLSPHWLPTTTSDFEDLQLTSRDILEVTASARASRKSLASIYKIVLDHHLLPKHLSRQGFNKKVEQAENKFQALHKAHSARCKKEGSHKTKELLTLLESKFFGVTCKLQQQMSTSEQATLVVFGDAEVEQSLKAGATLTLQVDPPAIDEHFHSLSKDRQEVHLQCSISKTHSNNHQCPSKTISKMQTQKLFRMHQFGFLLVGWIFSLFHMVSETYSLLSTRQMRMHLSRASPYGCFPNIDFSIHTV